jgi:hypothetical protein
VVPSIWATDGFILANQSLPWHPPKVRFMYYNNCDFRIVTLDRTPRSTLPSRPKSIGDQPGDLGRIGEAIGFSGVLKGAIGRPVLATRLVDFCKSDKIRLSTTRRSTILEDPDKNIERNAIFLLCGIGIYRNGIDWYSLEQQFIRWNLKIAKRATGESYGFIDRLGLIEKLQKGRKINPMRINSTGEAYLMRQGIDIKSIRNQVNSMDDVKSQLLDLEEFLGI